MRRAFLIGASFLIATAATAQRSADPIVAIGKQRAAASSVEWDVRDVTHPLLGSIKVAVQRSAVATPVRGGKVVSSAFVSCQKGTGKIAIELASAPESNPATGLGPIDLPRLVCTALRPQGDLAKKDLAASWEISGLGDALTRGLSPAALRECVAIEIVQNLALPPGWPQSAQKVSMDITPYGRDLDAVFSECGEPSAYPVEEHLATPRLQAPAVPAHKPEAPPRAVEVPWKAARAIAHGRTNVRSAASIESGIVTHLDPGARIFVQPAADDWWRVQPRGASAPIGYIRRDRFTFE